jgi:hypothetical protein
MSKRRTQSPEFKARVAMGQVLSAEQHQGATN